MLVKKILVKGEIESKTGLHIGGTNNKLAIGGADATVVRNPVNNQPYIPGSSLKGKMRSLLEKLEGAFTKTGMMNLDFGPFVNPKDADTENKKLIYKIFGTMPEKMVEAEPTSRLIVRDCNLINAEEEIAKMEAEITYYEGFIESVMKKLGNERFVANAKPEIVEAERKKKADAESKIASLKDGILALKK